jgi:hypothetical protein
MLWSLACESLSRQWRSGSAARLRCGKLRCVVAVSLGAEMNRPTAEGGVAAPTNAR